MPLTHVCVWDSTIGYRRITVEEASTLYPYGVSASSGHFVCELCAQNVLFTAPGLNVRHFRHDPSSPNKECDERQASFDPTYGRSIKSMNSHTMPLRIALMNGSFELQLGFFNPPVNHAKTLSKPVYTWSFGSQGCFRIIKLGRKGYQSTWFIF